MSNDEQGRAYCEPAASLIEKCGGARKVADICGCVNSWVYRWRFRKGVNGGTGGRIPAGARDKILAASRDGRIAATITPDDFHLAT